MNEKKKSTHRKYYATNDENDKKSLNANND